MLDIKPRSDNMKLLLEALRSGKYTRGKKRLRDGDTFCPLGVACDVFLNSDEGSGFAWELDSDGTYMFTSRYYKNFGCYAKGFYSVLPPEANEWYGVDDNFSFFVYVENDIYNKDFPEVADFIKRHYVDYCLENS